MRAGLVAVAVVLGCAIAQARGPGKPQGPGVTAKELLGELGKLQGLRASFREEKTLALLVAPLVTEGTVYFQPPGRLVRVTSAPAWSTLDVRPGALIYADRTGERSLPMGADHPARAFVQVFVDVVEGDVAALERNFTVKASGSRARWTLALTPRQRAFAGVTSIEIVGAGPAIETLTLVESTGDRTVTRFAAPSTARPSDAEIAGMLKRPR